MSDHRDTSLEDRALAIVAALPESVIDALALRLAQRRGPITGAVDECRDREARDRLIAHIAEHGPVSQRQARSAAGVAGRTADAVIRGLERDGEIQDVGTGRSRAWMVCPKGARPLSAPSVADTPDTQSDALQNGSGDRTEPVADSGTIAEFIGGLCDDPTTCRYLGRHATGPWDCTHNHPREQA